MTSGEPSPLLEQVDGSSAVPFERDGHVDLFVRLGAPPESVGRRQLGQRAEHVGPVAVDARWADRELPAAVAGPVLVQHPFDGAHGQIDVVARGAVDEYQAHAELASGDGRRAGDGGARSEVGRPVEVMVGDGGDPVQQRLGDADRRRGQHELFVDADLRVVAAHGGQPLGHGHVACVGRGAERRLQQVVVRVHQAGHHDATGCVETGDGIASVRVRWFDARDTCTLAMDVDVLVLVRAGPHHRRSGHGEHAVMLLTLTRTPVTAL